MIQQLAPELERCEPGHLKAEKLPTLEMVIRIGEELTPGMLNFNEVCKLGGNPDGLMPASIYAHLTERLQQQEAP